MTDVSFIAPKLHLGRKFIFWDTAHSTRKTADFSAGVVFFIEDVPEGNPVAWLLEVSFGRWTNTELAQHIVALHKKWEPQATLIEQLVTISDLFQKEIYNEQIRQQVNRWDPVWFKPDTQPKAKEGRISAIEPLMTNNRFKICIGANTNASFWIDELKKQFLGYTGHKSNKNAIGGRHDDLIDAAGYLYKVMPMGVHTAADQEIEERLRARREREKMYQMIHGAQSSFTPINTEAPEEVSDNPIYRALSLLKK
jgi:hypothetical protein